jgi:hypothetical protein
MPVSIMINAMLFCPFGFTNATNPHATIFEAITALPHPNKALSAYVERVFVIQLFVAITLELYPGGNEIDHFPKHHPPIHLK